MHIFISGISRGLGRSLAQHYAARGEQVTGISRSLPDERIPGVRYGSADLTAPDAMQDIAQLVAGFPCIDLLINNAGTGSSGCHLAEVDGAELMAQLRLHCLAPLQISQALLGKLQAARSPKIINVTSRLGSVLQHQRGDFDGKPFTYPYRIAKAAQNMLSLCMSSDPSLQGIVVASVNPGLLQTDSGSSDACFSAEQGAARMVALIDGIDVAGLYHAFGDEALY